MAAIKMTVPSTYDTTGIEHFTIKDFEFQNGDKQTIHVAYRQFNPSASKKALHPTCYGGRVNDTYTFASGALSDYHVVVVAMLGNGESSAPSNQPGFPAELDYRDCVRAQHTLLTQHLNFTHLDVVVGFSMGGQQAYHWACMHPEFVKKAVPICTSATTSPHNFAFLAGPEAGLVRAADYKKWKASLKEGDIGQDASQWPMEGLGAFGRAWCAWGFGAAWFRAGHWKKDCKTIDEWVQKNGETSFQDWHPSDLLILLKMWQKGDVAVFDKSGSYEKALADIKIPVLVIPCRTDTYFPPEDSEIEIKHLKHGTLKVIESEWGHVAGGGGNDSDNEFMDKEIRAFLNWKLVIR